MKCPFCGHLEDKVVDSRSKKEGRAIRRRRECLGCGARYTTYEHVEELVRKQDSSVEPFDRGKLKRGIMLATVKRPVSPEAIDELVNAIELQCHESGKQEYSSTDIGTMVMDRLRQLDEVAYIRFASVYRRFQDVGAFRRELDNM